VRFERTDIRAKPVLLFVAGLVVVVIAVNFALAGMFRLLQKREQARDRANEQLPAAEDPARRRPTDQPMPETIEDVRRRDVELWPPRARRYLERQERLLEKGGVDPETKQKTVPIQDAIDALADNLPARKRAPPDSHLRSLPSKASSGRTQTGGQ
jgi:hypothetical protein